MKYKIGELASLLNVSTNTIRRYESKGYIQSEHRNTTNYRCFDEIDSLKFIDVRLLRKYGFSHEETEKLCKSNFDDLISIYTDKINELDIMLNYYSSLKKRLNSNITLLKKMEQPSCNNRMRESIEFSYILYQSGDIFLNEKHRLSALQNYLYKSPEVFRIYIAKKSDLDNGNILIHAGLAVKAATIEPFHLIENEYTIRYEKQLSLVHYIKVPLSSENSFLHNKKQIKANYIKKLLKQLDTHKLKLNGDILFLVVAVISEQERKMERILINIPVTPLL